MSGIQSTCQNCGAEILLRYAGQWYELWEEDESGERRHDCPTLKERAAGDLALARDIWRNIPQDEEETGALPQGGPDGRLVATVTRDTDPDRASRERRASGEIPFMSSGASQGFEGKQQSDKHHGSRSAGKGQRDAGKS